MRSSVRVLRIDGWDGNPGGAQDYIREVTGELARRGHSSRVLQLTNAPSILPAPTGTTYPVADGRVRRLGTDIITDDVLATAIRTAVREFAPDLISLHHFDAHFATLGRVLPEFDAPLVIANHDAQLVCPISTLVRPGGIICEGGIRFRCLFTGCHVGLGGPYNLWQRRLFDAEIRPRARAFLCPSRSLTDYLHSNGYRPAIHIPSFAKIPDTVRAGPTPEPSAETPPTVGYIGRLEWYKGVDDLIRGIAALSARRPTIRLDIAGEGPFEPTLRRLATSLGVADRVIFRGRVGGPAKESWFAGIHVMAVPSSMWENFPLVALEALTRGRAVVATRIGGIPDIVEDGETGRLVPIASPGAIADALDDLFANPETARTFGLEGRRRVLDRFTPEKHVERLLAVYERILAGGTFTSGMDAADLVGAAA